MPNLRDQAKRWSEAQSIRAFCDAAARNHPSDDDVSDWLEWSRGYADQIDPLRGAPPRGPELPDTITASDLVPYLDGWSPYGPR
jgi:hypothetical protein